MHISNTPIPEGIRRRDAFVLTLAQALHLFGTPSHRLEQAMEGISKDLDMQLQILATPTSLTAAIGSLEDQRTFLMRVEPSEANLEKLAELQQLMQLVSQGELGHGEAKAKIESLIARPPRYGVVVTLLAFSLISACAAVLFGGSWYDGLISAAVGGGVGLFLVVAAGRTRLEMLAPTLTALFAAIAARVAGHLWPQVNPFIITLASLIVLLPGLSLTTGVNELAHRHLVSGTARMMGSLVIMLQLALGVAGGWGIATSFWGDFTQVLLVEHELWIIAGVVIAAAMAFTVLFKAKPQDFGAIFLGGGLAYFVARWGTDLYGPEFGAALGAWSMGCLANILARLRNKPALTTILPGMILLVPGSLGFRSLQALLHDQLFVGVEIAMTTVMVAIALVIGLFLSNLTISPRKIL